MSVVYCNGTGCYLQKRENMISIANACLQLVVTNTNSIRKSLFGCGIGQLPLMQSRPFAL